MPASFLVRGEAYLESERVNSLSGPAEKFYWRLMCAADSFGRMDARPAILRTRLYSLQLDKIRESDMPRLLAECEKAGLVRCYEISGKPYLQIDKFEQRLRTKPKYPAPPADTPAADLPQTCRTSAAHLPQTCRTSADVTATECNNVCRPAADLPHEYEYEYEYEKENEKEEGEYITPRSISEPPHTPPTSIFRDLQERETYRHWLHAVKPAHPSGREMQTLPKNLHTLAITAFRTVPQAADHADLLRAFYDSTITISTKTGRPFKKPDIFQYYLTDLADVLTAAKQWAKELKWKPRTKNTPSNIQNPKSNIQNNDLATQEETAAFLADMREALATIGQPPPSDYLLTD